MKRSIIAY